MCPMHTFVALSKEQRGISTINFPTIKMTTQSLSVTQIRISRRNRRHRRKKTTKTLICAACSTSKNSKFSFQVLFKPALQPLIRHHRIAYGFVAQLRKTEKIAIIPHGQLSPVNSISEVFPFQGYCPTRIDGVTGSLYLDACIQVKAYRDNIKDEVEPQKRGFLGFC